MTRYSIAGLSLCLACLVLGCNESGDPKPLSVVLRGDPATKAQVETILKANPELVVPGRQTKYSMIVVKPDAGVDYKVLQVTPDPRVDYKILVVDPASGRELADLSRKLGGALRQRLQQEEQELKE